MSALRGIVLQKSKVARLRIFAKTLKRKQSPIRITLIALPKSPETLTCGDEAPHIFIPNPHQQPRIFEHQCKTTFSTQSGVKRTRPTCIQTAACGPNALILAFYSLSEFLDVGDKDWLIGFRRRLKMERVAEMGRQVVVALYVVAMAAVIVGIDFVFFTNRFWERLTVNIGIVLVFAAFYMRFLR